MSLIPKKGTVYVVDDDEAVRDSIDDLDGSFTYLVSTAEGFGVARDRFSTKPCLVAETDDWVAMSSEWRSIAVLPGAADARAWEPEPLRWMGINTMVRLPVSADRHEERKGTPARLRTALVSRLTGH